MSVPSVPSGCKVQMLLKNPGWEDKYGNFYVVPEGLTWVDVSESDKLRSVSECEHIETICVDCIEAWGQDWMFRIVDEKGNTAEWVNTL